MRHAPSIAAFVWFAAGCAGSYTQVAELPVPGSAVVLVGQHPDEARHRLYSVNYLQQGFIPRCTPVQLVRVTDDAATFTVSKTGVTYTYFRHKSTPDFLSNVRQVFGPACDALDPAAFTDVDRQGIDQGQVMPGMSKAAVVYAVGYPPVHATADLESDEWRYWKSRFDTLVVRFQNGRVVEVRN